MAYWKHESAFVDEGAVVGEGTKVWHFTHVAAGARIGDGCVLGQNVYVAPTAILGHGVRVQNNVSVYDGVVIGDLAFIGPSAVFTNVGRPRSEISKKGAYETTRVGRGVTIGANATVVCGHSLGDYAFVGAGAVVTKDVAAHALVVGVPARQVGWACRCGERLPDAQGDSLSCACACACACGQRYLLVGDALTDAK